MDSGYYLLFMKTGEVMKRLLGLLQQNYSLQDLVVKVRPFSAAQKRNISVHRAENLGS